MPEEIKGHRHRQGLRRNSWVMESELKRMSTEHAAQVKVEGLYLEHEARLQDAAGKEEEENSSDDGTGGHHHGEEPATPLWGSPRHSNRKQGRDRGDTIARTAAAATPKLGRGSSTRGLAAGRVAEAGRSLARGSGGSRGALLAHSVRATAAGAAAIAPAGAASRKSDAEASPRRAATPSMLASVFSVRLRRSVAKPGANQQQQQQQQQQTPRQAKPSVGVGSSLHERERAARRSVTQQHQQPRQQRPAAATRPQPRASPASGSVAQRRASRKPSMRRTMSNAKQSGRGHGVGVRRGGAHRGRPRRRSREAKADHGGRHRRKSWPPRVPDFADLQTTLKDIQDAAKVCECVRVWACV